MSKKEKSKILETTLRDGSYTIDFQFTTRDTERICQALEEAGFDTIEIGHGVGLNASNSGQGKAAQTDTEYMEAAARVLKKAKFGMFCIPGIARLEDVDKAGQHGMGFIRIGTDVSRMEESEPFIERAKKYGMFVCANFMKSYAMESKQFAQKAKLSQKFGAEVVYVVDSAGGMLPSDVEEYIRAIQDVCDVKIGFHGHNNLELAIANSLKALELGAYLVDTSLQGLGRSAGNTPTELYVSILEKKGLNTSALDPIKIMDIGEKYIKPLIQRRGYESLDTVCGMADFHSSFMATIRDYSSRYDVDPRQLIMAVTKKNKVSAPKELVENEAKNLIEKGQGFYTARFNVERYHGSEQSADDK
ncbi:hypothetical protein BVX98_04285 [bacterium F11]|nr:hypothetical protein BVX98_04285 [bacterium F11]